MPTTQKAVLVSGCFPTVSPLLNPLLYEKSQQEGKAMTNLIRLPATNTMTAQQALESALVDAETDHLKDVLICGYTEGGVLYIRSSRLNRAQAFFIASKAALWAQNGGVE